jgi:hypothetical protein
MKETYSFSTRAYVIVALNVNFTTEISKLKCERWNPFVANIFHVKFTFIVMSKERIGPFINVASSILLPSSCRSF